MLARARVSDGAAMYMRRSLAHDRVMCADIISYRRGAGPARFVFCVVLLTHSAGVLCSSHTDLCAVAAPPVSGTCVHAKRTNEYCTISIHGYILNNNFARCVPPPLTLSLHFS